MRRARDLDPLPRRNCGFVGAHSPQRPRITIYVIASTNKLIEVGIDASIGATGSSYDNALAETINGLYKTELIKPRGPWRTVEHVEIAALEWMDWFNHRRLYEHCGDVPPAELEAFYYGEHRTTRIAEFSNQ
ncbi:transposase [Rhodococcus sp. IC4_135]|nr:transposase [Rhodococcus sp. IC4_135]